jgi:RimJ/RimL family protein N-acetyltransferase
MLVEGLSFPSRLARSPAMSDFLPEDPDCPPLSGPLPDVETERLVLRRFRKDDEPALAQLFAKPEIWQFPYGRGLDRAETRAFLQRQLDEWDRLGSGLWVAVHRISGDLIGYVGLAVPRFLPSILPAMEVGWRFDPAYWGSGYATEGARAALKAGFGRLGLDAICSVPQSDNYASVRVCQRLGMRFERQVEIPANEQRGALAADLFWIESNRRTDKNG